MKRRSFLAAIAGIIACPVALLHKARKTESKDEDISPRQRRKMIAKTRDRFNEHYLDAEHYYRPPHHT